MLFDAFQLLGFPDALLFSLIGFTARLFLLVALLIGNTLFLVLASLFITHALFLKVLLLLLLALHEGLLGLLEPQDILDKLCFDFVGNHLLIVVFFSFVFLSLELSDQVPDLGSLVINLLQLSSVTFLGIIDIFVLFLYFVDFVANRTKKLLELGKVFRIFFLLATQLVDLGLQLSFLKDQGLRGFNLIDFLD